MKIRNLLIAISAVSLSPLALESAAQSKVIVINQAKIRAESKAGVDIVAKLKTITERVNSELKPTADSLAKEQKSIEDRMRPLNEAAIRQDAELMKRYESFLKRAQEFDVKCLTRANELDVAQTKAWADFYQGLKTALDSVIAEQSADVVLDQSTILYNSDASDMTDEVISKLNAAKPTVAVSKDPLPENARLKSVSMKVCEWRRGG